ncbi:3-methyladenine DNA glycosylase [Calidifontibacter sp. DB0510]|uniref:3-methyladenine DNA glycosylase n=1 Tax=Metallococcus carri TaxID=1656884 RepID=A0A967EAC1_9MICO|nr:3-methyladenine DNA glycosylase [Metallococcus carri]NHN55729.1 3-methyladenine DNA glycosylase [Metallococcus carri]NOP38582.1 3-methyladenine DNA glycosylase [Calidifontibacter sp. DB2511S]
MERWHEDRWRAAAQAHEARVDAAVAGHLHRRDRGIRHPVEDFLFQYYRHQPSHLRVWHPGLGIALEGARERAAWPFYTYADRAAFVDDVAFASDRQGLVRSTVALLRATLERPATFSCFGLHEWAMVYRSAPADIRHTGLPLRLGHDGTDAVVEQHPLRCSHFDAYRFFTDPAKPRNSVALQADSRTAYEQPGCLHAGMDLYKHAYRLSPAVGSDLVMDCFELAREIRTLDMQASPYDVSSLGLEPVAIETTEGRAEYARRQREFSERARPLRERLLAAVAPLRTAAPARRAASARR